ncbi:MAG: spore cortex biosynthesis protein YabQ [Clostridia bacterium]|nr:spore cortex biosynthesis protein YabQ [Clostridia bacterium]
MTATLTQGAEFLAAVYAGMLTGLIYDGFRLLRLPFPDRRIVHAVFDLLFYAAAGLLTAVMLLSLADGAVRLFHILGIGAGAFLQQYFLSRPVRKLLARLRTRLQNLQKKSSGKAGNPNPAENKNRE